MAITPVDITHIRFKTSFRGYNRQEVDAFVQSVKEALEQALTEKSELQRRLETVQEELDRIRKIEATMSSALTIAQRTADEVRTNARRQAEMILQEAEQSRVRMTIEAQKEVERLQVEIAKLQGVRDRLIAELSSTLDAFKDLLERRVVAFRAEEGVDAGSNKEETPDSSSCANLKPQAPDSPDAPAPGDLANEMPQGGSNAAEVA
ncbi:MAG: DivIVA domain-containing protein [Armatimonadota bacterium]|nr:DivIVA domain-containing protein [Armatimonadota bacterium]